MSSSKRFEKFSAIFLLAGLSSLIIAFLVLGLGPAAMVYKMPKDGGLPREIPQEFQSYYANLDEYQQGLLRGRDHYVAEACWHCHSQYVRPVSNEALRYGPVSQAGEYQNVLQLPQLLGTRRVGPDLSREAGKRPNDWQFAHLYEPKSVEPRTVMPSYSWYFETKTTVDEAGVKVSTVVPKQSGIDLVAYIQSLGAQVSQRSVGPFDPNAIVMPPTE